MNDSEVGITEKLIKSGCTPFSVPISPSEVHDFEIYASLGRVLREGPMEGKSYTRAERFREDFLLANQEVLRGNGATILHAIEKVSPIPGSSGQSSKRRTFPIVPFVPSIGEVSCFTRQSEKAWNAGAYIREMILRGSKDFDSAKDLWGKLFHTYFQPSVSQEKADAWAVFAEESISALSKKLNLVPDDHVFKMRPLENTFSGDFERGYSSYPARSFVIDLEAILKLNNSLTRRQWVSLVDCHLRISLASDILWIYRMSYGLENLIKRIWEVGEVPVISKIRSEIMPDDSFFPMILDGEFFNLLKREVGNHGSALLFIQNVIRAVREEDEAGLEEVNDLGDLASLEKFLKLASKLPSQTISKIKSDTQKLIDSNPEFSKLSKSKFWTCQHYYALRHALGQRATKDKQKTHFDQGYWAKRKGNPWKFSPGPLALFLMTHLANEANNGIATAFALKSKLGEYGFYCTLSDLCSGEIGEDLRRLGLSADCSDALGGLIVRSPFK